METIETDILEPFQATLDRLEAARAHTHQFGNHRSHGDRREDALNSINYEDAKEAEAAVVDELVDEVNGVDESMFTGPQKAMVVKVLAHQWRTPLDESRLLIADGFAAFERLQKDIELNRDIVAQISINSIALYVSRGADDIEMEPIDYERGHQAISLRMSGQAVSLQSLNEESFPDRSPTEKIHTTSILYGGHSNRIAEMMSPLDPESSSYKLPFVRLGSAEQPLANLGTLIDESLDVSYPTFTRDATLYAARLLTFSMGLHDRLEVEAPSDELKGVFIDRFAAVYADLLSGVQPRDTVVTRHNHRGGLHDTTERKLRSRSLAHLGADERRQRFYAADVSPDDIEAATRERLKRSGSAASIAHALRAGQIIDAFFEQVGSDS